MQKLIIAGLLSLSALAACTPKAKNSGSSTASSEASAAPAAPAAPVAPGKPANPTYNSYSVDSEYIERIMASLVDIGAVPTRDDDQFREYINVSRVKVERSDDGKTTTLSIFMNNAWKKGAPLDPVAAPYAWKILHEQPGCSSGTPEASLSCQRLDDRTNGFCNADYSCAP